MNYLILLLIAMVFFPGFAWAFVDSYFFHSKHKSFSFFIAKSFMFGMVTYLILGYLLYLHVDIGILDSESDIKPSLFYGVMNPTLELIKFFGDILTNPIQIVRVDGMLEVRDIRGELQIPILGFLNLMSLSIPVSVVLIFIWVFLKSRNMTARILNLTNITESWGSENVWTHTLNRRESKFQYVRLINFDTNYVCEGFVDSYSEGEETLAILLKDVRIYNLADSSIDYQISTLYVSNSGENIWMEFPEND